MTLITGRYDENSPPDCAVCPREDSSKPGGTVVGGAVCGCAAVEAGAALKVGVKVGVMVGVDGRLVCVDGVMVGLDGVMVGLDGVMVCVHGVTVCDEVGVHGVMDGVEVPVVAGTGVACATESACEFV